MKLEIIKETSLFTDDLPWYKFMVDGVFITGSYELKKIILVYDAYKEDPTNFKKYHIEVLKSEEI